MDSFIDHAKWKNVYVDLAGDLEARFDISIFEVDRVLPTGKN